MDASRIRIIGFKTEYRTDKEVDWVCFTSADALGATGNITHSTWEKISRLIPQESRSNDDDGLKMAAMRSQWAQIEPAYRAWKDGQELPTTGTPLGAWPGVNPDQAEALRSVGLMTVESIASANETILSRPPLPGMREIKRQAMLWLEGRSSAEMAETIAKQQEQIDAMLAMLEEQAEKPAEEARRGPGRPRKIEAEEGAE
ncbi:MAG: helix-hairpin-helix domain-containing protein [Paracoccaceae bacterium]